MRSVTNQTKHTIKDESMSLNEIADTIGLRNAEDAPETILATCLKLIRSAMIGRPVSCQITDNAYALWEKAFGQPSSTSVRQWLATMPTVANLRFPNEFIKEVLEGDAELN